MRDEPYSKLFFGAMAIIFMFVFPIMIMGYSRRISAETRANSLVEEFLENARSTAYFTENDYEMLYNDLYSLGVNWDLEILHYSQRLVLNAEGNFESRDMVYTTSDILSTFDNSPEPIVTWELKKGDKLEVRADSKSEFMGLSIFKLFAPSFKDFIHIQDCTLIDNNYAN